MNQRTKTEKGITLIALVITIVVLLILAGVAINSLFGDNGVITKSQLSSFATEMKKIKENVRLKQNESALKIASGEATSNEIFDVKLIDKSEIDIPKTLMREIVYTRRGYPSEQKISDYKEEDYNNLENKELIYVIDKKTGDGKENTYIYDKKTDVVFKIPKTHIGGKVYHSYEIAQMQKGDNDNKDDEAKQDQVAIKESDVITVGTEIYYAPNMKGFNNYKTTLVYYNTSDYTDICDVGLKEYIENGEKSNIEKDGKTYTLHDYGNKVWANAKTTANHQEAWWVWIPRYAYKINGTTETPPIDAIYVGLDNKPLNSKYNGTLPEGYEVHPAFTVDGQELKGIWISKYEPSYKAQTTLEGQLAPDMTGFDKEHTYIELYDKDTGSFTDVKLADADLSTINNDKKWYDYSNKVWANIKTTANNQEAWWVWIPRYAYKLTGYTNNKMSDIIFVDLNNNPINKEEYPDGLLDGYEVHSAFTVDGQPKAGIWVSKYEPSYQAQPTVDGVLAPDMTGFDKEHTYIELYDKDTGSFTDVKLADADLSTINNDKKWYDYSNKIWANIKTDANGLEAWWVWIPRYAYRITSYTNYKMSEVIFVDLNNKPINTTEYPNGLFEGYEVHPAFTVDGQAKSGIWMSKYEPSNKSE